MEDADWWENMPDEAKAKLEKSLEEGERGDVITHEEVKKKYPQWFQNNLFRKYPNK